MKRKMTWIALVFAAIVLVCIGSVNAYMRKQTQVVENVFVPANVSCQVVETFTNNRDKTDVAIKNTSSINAYLRLRFVTYWIDSYGDIVYAEPATLNVDYDSANWIVKDNIYYYKDPVAPGEVTTDLLKTGAKITLTTSGNYRQVVEVFAEAIQSLPEKAVTESWGATVSGGKITAIK